MNKENYKVKVAIGNNETKECQLTLLKLGTKDYQLELEIDSLNYKAINTFPFIGLQMIRKNLEKTEYKLLCKGSRFNVYPSGSLLRGKMAYALTLGRSPERNEMVIIFDEESDINSIATVDEQNKFYDNWKKSLLKDSKLNE
jgi:hypothetical protein